MILFWHLSIFLQVIGKMKNENQGHNIMNFVGLDRNSTHLRR